MELAARQVVRRDIARSISTLAAPAPVASVLLVGVACHSATTLADGLQVGALLAACVTLPPTLYVEHMLVRGGVKHRYLAQRSQRIAPLAIGCASVLGALALCRALAAPRDLQTVLLTMLLVLGIALAAIPLTRMSVHMAAVTATSMVLQLCYGATGAALLPVVAIVGWSRLELGEHTPAQVVAGGIVGAIGGIAAYVLVR